MKTTKYVVVTVLLLCVLFSCNKVKFDDLNFLIGTWKVENKEQYEVWQTAGDNRLAGSGYSMKEGEKVVSEELEIKNIDGKVIYEATVLDQNDAQTVPFTLNPESKDWFSFENDDHDFPKKVRYQKVTDNELLVEVQGADGEGFSFKMLRQSD